MTHAVPMQQATENIDAMFPNSGNVDNMTSETHIEPYQSLDPSRASLEDYNRSMLQYTQRQMSSFVDMDESRRGSQSSSKSGFSITPTSGMSRQGNGSYTSVSNVETKHGGRDMAEAKSSGY
ncbi:hypothetical protein N7517_008730 [Penicillium concentricum]|uniref:Uncharacterized protein n=1 Tax=Penicillium concentricum TaxID=293559 RepID=A0A9W9V308_9EURO|nr:uncharacterized protein N7517_008730 [Penicillium concentricum]KAJ5365844.1 hypothetical protein N7517_008730 [Penicillium concentricum]